MTDKITIAAAFDAARSEAERVREHFSAATQDSMHHDERVAFSTHSDKYDLFYIAVAEYGSQQDKRNDIPQAWLIFRSERHVREPRDDDLIIGKTQPLTRAGIQSLVRSVAAMDTLERDGRPLPAPAADKFA